jgi:hypothetical protein
MSQYPPQQPPQYPPSQFPPGSPPPGGYPGGMPQGQQSNGLAITSLIMGILSCVPGVGLLAILFGALGLGKAKDPRVGGKGLAIVGIVLGLLSLVAYAGVGYFAYWGVGKLKQMSGGIQFMEALNRSNIDEAKTYTTGKMSDSELQQLSATIKTLGKFKELKNPNTKWDADVFDVSGTAVFENGTKQAHFVMVKTGDGYKVDKLTLE